MKKQILLSLGIWFLAQSAFAGGGLIGSGGDGLVVDSVQAQDVVVPVPGQISSYGQLQVIGTPGAGQGKTFYYSRCERGRDGRPVRFSCKDGQERNLNERISLPGGYYKVFYSGSQYSELLEVKKNQLQVVELKKIQIPRVNGKFAVQIFRDLTDRSEQEKVLWDVFTTASNQADFGSSCEDSSPEIKAACAAYRSGDYHNLLGPGIRFGEDGSWSAARFFGDGSFDRFKNRGRYMVTDDGIADGDFISVFSGVYGLTFTDSTTGREETQYGVQVD